MELFSILVMTVFATGLVALLIASSQDSNLYSVRNLFMAAWLYYGFSVGVDLLTGAEIPYTYSEARLMDDATWGSVAFVMWNYVLCGVTFLLAYTFFGQRPPQAVDRQYELRLPPAWFLVGLHFVAAYVFITVFFSMNRMERIAVANTSTIHKFAALVVPLVLAFDIIVIVCDRGNLGRLAWLSALPLALATGNRNYVLFVFLIAAFRWRPSLRGWKLVMMATTCGLVIFVFKTVYAIGLDWWLGHRVNMTMVYDNLQVSLSGLDAVASYLIAIFYTEQPSPWWLGQTYVQTPLLISWPRFLGGVEATTLAEDYIWTYHPWVAQRGGGMAFSAVAEAWLNFSYLGPLVLGCFWGTVARFFDSRPRGIAFYVLLLMVVRLFRSDFATLYKNWGLVWGTLFVLVFAALVTYTAVTTPRRGLPTPASRHSTLGLR